MKYIFLWLFLLAGATRALCQDTTTTIILKKNSDLLLVGKETYFLEDIDGKMTIQEVIKNKFALNKSDIFGRPAGKSVFWLKFHIKNQTQEKAWIELGNSFLWYIDYYTQEKGKYILTTSTGSLLPDSTKAYPVNLFWLPLKKTSEIQTVYMRIYTQTPLDSPIQVGTTDALYQNKTQNDYVLGAFVGLVVIMFGYNMFLFFVTRDKIYRTYLAYLFLVLFVVPFLNHYYYVAYLFGDSSKVFWYKYFFVWHNLIFITISIFAIRFLNLSVRTPVFYKFIVVLTSIISGVIPALNLFQIVPLYILFSLFQLFVLVLYLSLLGIGYYLWLVKKQRDAFYYSIAWTWVIISTFIFLFSINGILPYHYLTRNATFFGISLEILFFSLALGDRINIMRREKEKAEAETLQLIKEQNVVLEQKVVERTKNLQEAQDQIMVQNEELKQQQEELKSINDVLEVRNKDIERKNKNITSSIVYAQRIQQAVLPLQEGFDKSFPDNFIFYKPRDIVSGDFYWHTVDNNKHFFAAIDCTGHGVPGAFMTLITHDLLNEIVKVHKVHSPDLVLNELRRRVLQELRQKDTGNQDGMEISFCCIDYSQEKTILQFAGNGTALTYIVNGEAKFIKSDLLIIGGFRNYLPNNLFTLHTIPVEETTTFYFYSDGYQDQFGGENDKKFGVRSLREMLKSIYTLSMQAQHKVVGDTIEKWMSQNIHKQEQIDDIMVIGIKIK